MRRPSSAAAPILASVILLGVLASLPVASADSTGQGSPGSASIADPGALSLLKTYSGQVGYAVADAGLAMATGGSGSVTVSGIPGGSTVLNAFLFWNVVDKSPAGSYSSVSFAGNAITGTLLGGTTAGDDPCYSSVGADTKTSPTYEGDVTSYVTGNGAYSLSGFPPGFWPTLPFAEGASLVVVYRNPSLPSTVIDVADGFGVINNLVKSETSTLTLSPKASGASAVTTFIFGNPEGLPTNVVFQGTNVMMSTPDDAPYFAEYTLSVSSLVPSGTGSVSFGSSLVDNCLIHLAQVLQYTPSASSTAVPQFGSPVILVVAVAALSLAVFKRLATPGWRLAGAPSQGLETAEND